MESGRIQATIALVIIIGFLALLGAWFVVPLKGDATLFNVLAGALAASLTAVIQYYFGSSSGSKSKDAALSSIATANAAPTNGPTNVTPLVPKTG